MITHYIGDNVAVIDGLPYGGTYAPAKTQIEGFRNKLDKLEYRYIVATTANKFQKEARTILQENKFKEVITFYSSHGDKSETLTFWLKEQKKHKKDIKQNIGEPQYNCTVNYNKPAGNKIFTAFTKGQLGAYQNGKNLKIIPKTPIFFYVEDRDIVGKADAKLLTSKFKKGKVKLVDMLYNGGNGIFG
jgi:hypothetical protein